MAMAPSYGSFVFKCEFLGFRLLSHRRSCVLFVFAVLAGKIIDSSKIFSLTLFEPILMLFVTNLNLD